MKTTSEMVKVCRTCKKRTFNPEQGIVCSLTNAKPTFGDECPELELDEEQLKREEMAAKANEETISDGRLEGSSWFMWIALLSLANIVRFFVFTIRRELTHRKSIRGLYHTPECHPIAMHRSPLF